MSEYRLWTCQKWKKMKRLRCNCMLMEIIRQQQEKIVELINENQEQADEIEVLMGEILD